MLSRVSLMQSCVRDSVRVASETQSKQLQLSSGSRGARSTWQRDGSDWPRATSSEFDHQRGNRVPSQEHLGLPLAVFIQDRDTLLWRTAFLKRLVMSNFRRLGATDCRNIDFAHVTPYCVICRSGFSFSTTDQPLFVPRLAVMTRLLLLTGVFSPLKTAHLGLSHVAQVVPPQRY